MPPKLSQLRLRTRYELQPGYCSVFTSPNASQPRRATCSDEVGQIWKYTYRIWFFPPPKKTSNLKTAIVSRGFTTIMSANVVGLKHNIDKLKKLRLYERPTLFVQHCLLIFDLEVFLLTYLLTYLHSPKSWWTLAYKQLIITACMHGPWRTGRSSYCNYHELNMSRFFLDFNASVKRFTRNLWLFVSPFNCVCGSLGCGKVPKRQGRVRCESQQ